MQTNLFNRIENAKTVEFGGILSKSFELFKKVWVEGFIHFLISLIVVIPFLLVIYIPLLPMYADMLQNAGDPYYQPEIDFAPLQMIGWVLLVFLLSIVLQVVSLAISAHFMRVLKKHDTGTPVTPGGYFDDLRENFLKLFTLSLATFGIALLATLLCYFPIFYVIVPLQLIIPIFAFNKDLTVSEIISAGFKLGNKYWLIVFGLILVGGLIAQLGIIACGIGVFFTAYFAHIPIYYFYKDSVGFEDPGPDASFN